jgi:hypothetical protein
MLVGRTTGRFRGLRALGASLTGPLGGGTPSHLVAILITELPRCAVRDMPLQSGEALRLEGATPFIMGGSNFLLYPRTNIDDSTAFCKKGHGGHSHSVLMTTEN